MSTPRRDMTEESRRGLLARALLQQADVLHEMTVAAAGSIDHNNAPVSLLQPMHARKTSVSERSRTDKIRRTIEETRRLALRAADAKAKLQLAATRGQTTWLPARTATRQGKEALMRIHEDAGEATQSRELVQLRLQLSAVEKEKKRLKEREVALLGVVSALAPQVRRDPSSSKSCAGQSHAAAVTPVQKSLEAAPSPRRERSRWVLHDGDPNADSGANLVTKPTV